MKRLFLLIVSKFKGILNKNIALSSRVEYSNVSKKARVWGWCKLYHASVGDYSYIGSHCRLIHAHVGKFCSIAGDYSQIGMGKHSLDYLSTSSLFTVKKNGTGSSWTEKQTYEEYEDIFIGNDVWIGSSVKVMPGVRIGNGAVVGAGSIVTKDIPPYTIVAGVPAKEIRKRFSDDVIRELLDIKWWDKSDEMLRENIDLFQNRFELADLEQIKNRIGG